MTLDKSLEHKVDSSSEQAALAAASNARQAALEQVQPELASIDASGMFYNVDAAHVVSVVQLATNNIEPFARDLGSMPTLDVKPIERLPLYSLALWQASILVESCAPNASKFDDAMAIARPLREELIEAAQVLARRKKLSQEQVDKIRAGLGHRDLIDDLASLVELLEPFAAVGGVVEPESIATASKLADDLPLLLAQRNGEHPDLPKLIAQRNKLAVLVVGTYDDLRAAMGFLRRKHGDRDKLVPSLYVAGARPNKRDDKQPEPAKPVTPVAPVTPAKPGEPSDRPFEDPR
jgi:hypothetical protein